MKRRSFFAAVAPLILAVPALAQSPAASDDAAGRLKPAAPGRLDPKAPAEGLTPAEKPAPADAPAERAVPAAEKAAPGAEKAEKAPKGPTEITANEAMLDNKNNLAVFSGQVDVVSPEYNVSCDKLTIYLKPEKPKPGDAKGEEPKPIGAEDKGEQPDGEGKEGNSRIDKAIAEGNVRILQNKPALNGKKAEMNLGTGKRAVFDNTKGTCTLYGWPRVQQSEGGKLTREIVPLTEGTVIVMSPERIDVVQGRGKVRLLDGETLEIGPKANNR